MLSLISFCDRQGILEILLHDPIDQASGDCTKTQSHAEFHLDARQGHNGSGGDNGSIHSGNDSDSGSDSDLSAQQSNCSDNDRFENDVLILQNFSFIIANVDRVTFEMHRLVQLATLEWFRAQDVYEH